jgi:hypothetical protein
MILIKKEMLYAHLTSYSFDFLKISNEYKHALRKKKNLVNFIVKQIMMQ